MKKGKAFGLRLKQVLTPVGEEEDLDVDLFEFAESATRGENVQEAFSDFGINERHRSSKSEERDARVSYLVQKSPQKTS